MQIPLQFEEDRLMTEVSQWEHSESDKGQIFTRSEVVDFMLNVIGLNTSQDLINVCILEPSCGEGEFVVAIVKRLIDLPKRPPTIEELTNKLLAVDLIKANIEITKNKVAVLLKEKGYNDAEIILLLDSWFISADFLLEYIPSNFTHIIGNPPYVRVENIPKYILGEYRRRFSTMTHRADLYVPFYEKSLSLLSDGGRLSFICTDRWTKNTYGKSLRKLIDANYSLELFVDLYGVEAFEKEVMTYPAITQILKGKSNGTVLKIGTSFSTEEATEVLATLSGEATSLQVKNNIMDGDKPWLLGTSDKMDLIRKLESRFPLLERAGCKVSIGATTGANKVYIVDSDKLGVEIEEERLLPVITAKELKPDSIAWNGKYLINTYDRSGVINLSDYPKLENYLNLYKKDLCKRHVAKKDSARWFKTIDRVYEERAKMEKLLIPDISNEPIVLYDKGDYHPNNSIYYVISNEWNLNALRVILLSGITKLFISTYSTKIAKGYFRFQAQHLRKLRIPKWNSLTSDLKEQLIIAGKNNYINEYTRLACDVYELNEKEKLLVEI